MDGGHRGCSLSSNQNMTLLIGRRKVWKAGGIPPMIFVAEKCNAYFKVVKQEKKIHVGNLDRINQNLLHIAVS